MTTNTIPSDQAAPAVVNLLRARQNTYKAAKWALGVFVVLSIAVPVLGAVAGKVDPAGAEKLKPYFALAGLLLLFLDVGLLQRKQKDSIKRAAKLGEEFDTTVLRLPWNRFVAGEQVLPEDVREASKTRLSDEREGQIASWYEQSVGEVSLHFGRLICQRTNINYDQRLRRRYGNWLLGVTFAVGVGLFVIAFMQDSKLSELVLNFLAPFSPVLAWALREHRKQLDTATALEKLQGEFRTMWAEAINGASEAEMQVRSRLLQDAIYQHRASAPLVFDWVYRLSRAKNEDEAAHAARLLVDQAKAAVAGRAAA